MRYILENWRHLLELSGQHLQLSLTAVVMGLVVGVAAGVLISHYRPLVAPVLWLVSVFQTIPALAFIGFVMIFLGLTRATGITVLFFYTLMPIVHATYTGLTQVEPGVVESARGMGMTPMQILTKVQLPLALPVILVGVRVAAVIAVGTASIMSLAGAGGLGQEIFAGIDRVQDKMILAGALPAALLAVLAEVAIGALEKLLTPQGLQAGGKKATRGSLLRQRSIVYGAAAVVLIAVVAGWGGGPRAGVVTIGSKDFTENILLGEITAQMIEAHTPIKVVRKLNLGGTKVNFDGMRNGSLDMYAEYDGTGYGIHLGHTEPIKDPARIYDQVKQEFEQRFSLTWSAPFGFNNTYALAMPRVLVQKHGIKSGSDLAPLSPQFVFGTTNEFMGRQADGFNPLAKAYGFHFKDVRTMTAGLRYKAVQQNDIQVMDAYATDGKLREFDLEILKDDRQFFPPYKGAMIVRMDTLAKNPGLLEAVNKLGGTMTDEVMRDMNYRVEVKGETVEAVARDFLRSKGLVK
jgi:osmoprotectant transport system permease protein